MILPPMAQDEEEFDSLLEVLDELRPRSILELGVYAGGTLARFAARFPEAVVVGVDPSPCFHVQPLGTSVIVGRSQDAEVRAAVLELNGGRPFDVVHVDGDHSLEAAAADWLWARAPRRLGGAEARLVALHDVSCTTNPQLEAWRLWARIRATTPADELLEIRYAGGDYGYGLWRRPDPPVA